MSVKVEQVRRRRLRRAVAARTVSPSPVTPPGPSPLPAPVIIRQARPRRSRAWIVVDGLLAAAAVVAVTSVVSEYRDVQADVGTTSRPAAVAASQGD